MIFLPNQMIATAKWAFSTRKVERSLAIGLDPDVVAAKPGDLIMGRIISIGQHPRIQLPSGRPSTLYPGDIVVLPCGARYAPDQFEGVAEIDPDGCDMLAGGGCLGRMLNRNDRVKAPTRVQPIGRLVGAGKWVLNLQDFAIAMAAGVSNLPVIAVLGAAMNSGKTTATVALSHGLSRAGWKVATFKGTGTGSFGDFNEYVDSGAHLVADFTDVGMVTTYLEPLDRIKAGIADLMWAGESAGAEVVVMEIADGLYQKETAALLADPGFRAGLSGVIFACGDALAAAGGVAELTRLGLRSMALTGILSCSPMASAEALAATGIEIVSRGQLHDPVEANRFAALVGASPRAATAA